MISREPLGKKTLCVDIFFILGSPFFTSISRNLMFTTASALKNRKKGSVYGVIKSVIGFYATHDYYVKTVLADNEFGTLKEKLMNNEEVDLNLGPPKAHIPEVERNIRAIKDRLRSVLSSMHFEFIPKNFKIELVLACVVMLNMIPRQASASPTHSPWSLITGRAIDYKKHFCLEPGAFCMVHEENAPTNSMVKRATEAIAIGPVPVCTEYTVSCPSTQEESSGGEHGQNCPFTTGSSNESRSWPMERTSTSTLSMATSLFRREKRWASCTSTNRSPSLPLTMNRLQVRQEYQPETNLPPRVTTRVSAVVTTTPMDRTMTMKPKSTWKKMIMKMERTSLRLSSRRTPSLLSPRGSPHMLTNQVGQPQGLALEDSGLAEMTSTKWTITSKALPRRLLIPPSPRKPRSISGSAQYGVQSLNSKMITSSATHSSTISYSRNRGVASHKCPSLKG